MKSNWKDMEPVDDFITQQTPGLKITQKVWVTCSVRDHSFAPGTDFTVRRWCQCRTACAGVPHHAYVISGSMDVIYKDGTVETCKAGDVCYWPAPHNFKSQEGAEIIQFSGSGALGEQAKVIEGLLAKMHGE